MTEFFWMLLAAGWFVTGSAAAAPITLRMSVPHASGVNDLVPFTDQTIALTFRADTSQVVALADLAGGGPGTCVPVDSALITIGGAAALQAAPPVFFCATATASIVGVFTTSAPTTATVYFAGSYSNAGITDFALASDFPSTANVFSLTKVTSHSLNLTGGGTASITVVPEEGTTFAATLSPTGIPTLGTGELAALSLLLALAAYRRYSGIGVKAPSTRSGTSCSFCHDQEDMLQGALRPRANGDGTPMQRGASPR